MDLTQRARERRVVAYILNGATVQRIEAPCAHVEKVPPHTAEWAKAWLGFIAPPRKSDAP
jgi:hypothetical protein